MMHADQYTLNSLEFDRIVSEVRKHCYSSGGKAYTDKMKPLTDDLLIEDRLQESLEMKELISFEEMIPLETVERIEELLEKVKIIGSILDPLQLKRLADFQTIIKSLWQYKKNKEEKYPHIVIFLKQLDPLESLILRIIRAVDQAGDIKDSASDQLRRIRIEKISARARILTRLERILGKKNHRSDRHDDIVTLREGRYVIAVADSDFNSSQGVVHDRSRSGATLYVEPTETIELNNNLKRLHLEEAREIERILLELTDFARGYIAELESNWSLYSKIDFIHARGAFAKQIDGVMPIIKSKPLINFMQAYHPLMLLAGFKKSEIIPNHHELGFDYNILIITGPNTGGKTVALKTVGLLTIMVQSGLLIPVDEKSEIGVFKSIYADIGDEQSIELSLSTFSSHIARIKKALKSSDENSLLLFDEIGVGTDPREGAALGEAIVNYVADSGAKCIVTTHYSALKAIAEEKDKIENASFEFDTKTLKPTYKLRTGLPGSSYAIEIASRLGLPKSIIDSAAKLVGGQERSLADLLVKLQEQMSTLEEEKEDLQIKLKSAVELESFWHSQSEKIKQEQKQLMKNGYSEADKLVEETRQKLLLMMKELQENKNSGKAISNSRRTIEDLRRELTAHAGKLNEPQQVGEIPEKGDHVWVERFQTEGDLIEILSSGKKGRVQIGKILYTMKLKDLRRVDKDKPAKQLPDGVNYQPFKDDLTNEVSLRGLTVDEAQERLDKFIDEIALANLISVRIVHGKGTGALRRMVRQYLANSPVVESFELGQWNEGGSGVTVVKIKQ